MQIWLPSVHFEVSTPGGLYLRSHARCLRVQSIARARKYLGLKIGDVTTAQSGVADVALTLTYGNP
jgi:hypothetical protein